MVQKKRHILTQTLIFVFPNERVGVSLPTLPDFLPDTFATKSLVRVPHPRLIRGQGKGSFPRLGPPTMFSSVAVWKLSVPTLLSADSPERGEWAGGGGANPYGMTGRDCA